MPRRRRSLKSGSCERRARKLSFEPLEERSLLSLTHWYTFNDGTANDLVGASHGTLHNGAGILGGQLTLQNLGVTSGQSTSVQYASLPAGVLPNAAATIEVWYTASNLANWSRVFDIGNRVGTAGDSYLFFTPQSGNNDSRADFKPSGAASSVVTDVTTDNGIQHMAAVVIDTSAGLLRLYMDGSAKGTAALNGANAGSINDTLAYIGRSLFDADTGFTGSVNELRIYDEAVSASQIASHAAAGPATSPLAADYNDDRTVDASDYVTWRKSGSSLGYNSWRANFGQTVQTTPLNLSDQSQTYATLANTIVTMTGRSELWITGTSDPLRGSTIHLNSPDAWLFVTNIEPSVVDANVLSQIRVNGAAAVRGTNVRFVQYELGTVVIPHAPSYQPLQAFSGPNFTGTSQSFSQYTYYDSAGELGTLNRNISSFKLKRGYMATIATQTSGGGFSKVYIAQDHDLDVALLPTEFDNAIQFVRVFPWRWVAKKGASDYSPDGLDSAWHYNWNNSMNSPLDWEYVPIQQQPFWPGAPTNQPDSTHWLGFNEPNNPVEDTYQNLNNGDVDAAIAWWPNMLATGLRVGSPAVTDGGKAWLYEFMDKAIAANLRVDYIAIHNYQAGHTAASLKAWLQDVYDRYHLPIWLTEFNNGANWTGGTDPTYEQNATVIGSFIDMMDTTPWIERYAIYGNVEDVRDVNYPDGTLTPMGLVYRNNASPISYVQEAVSSTNTAHRGITQLLLDGNTLDSSGYGNNGQVAGVPVYTAGQRGQALDFDGVNNFVRLPESVAHGDAFSFAGWVYWDGGGNWQRIFDFGNGTSQYLFLTPSNGSNMRFAIKNGGAEQIVQTTPLPVGQWTHVALTLGGGTARLYVNGSLAATNSGVTIRPSDFDPTLNYLGESQFAADPLFNGRLDDVRITDYVLTQAQIAGLMTDTPPQFSSSTFTRGPVSRGVPFSGTVAGTATDVDAGDTITYSKANGPAWLQVAADGILSGTPTSADFSPQEFVITATDSKGATAFAFLTISMAESYWRGDLNNSWNANNSGNTNWATDASGTTDTGAVPGATTDVVFAASNAANLPGTVLGANMSVRSLSVMNSAGVTIGGSHSLTIGADGVNVVSGSGTTLINTSGQVVLGANQTWTTGNDLTVSSVISGTASLTKTGTDTLILSGNNTYSGGTTIAAGTLQVGSGTTSGSIVGNVVNNGALIVNRSTDVTLGGAISGTGTLTKWGAGRLILTSPGTFTGGTTIGSFTGSGAVRASANNALGSGEITIGPGGNATTARLELSNNATLPNAIALTMRNNSTVAIQNISGNNALSGTITLQVGGSSAIFQSDAGLLTLGAITSDATGSRVPTLTGSGDGLVSGVISNGSATVGVTKSGAGTWSLGGANTYSGNTTVSAGTLALGGANRIANTSNMVLGGGTFATGGFSDTVGTLTLSSNSTIDFGAGVSTLTYSGAGTFTGGTTLTVTNWTQGSDQLFIGSTASLTPAQLAQINFSGTAAQQLSTGEVVPIGSGAGSSLAAGASAGLLGLGSNDGSEHLTAIDRGFEDLASQPVLRAQNAEQSGLLLLATAATESAPSDSSFALPAGTIQSDTDELNTPLSDAFATLSFESIWRDI
jgi:autotransporter-associated beta strand protein